MESIGKYWTPIYNILEPACHIVLAHPKYVKAIRGKKTDKKDAKWIAGIFKHDLVSGSFIPPADIRQLRDLMRCHWKLTNFTPLNSIAKPAVLPHTVRFLLRRLSTSSNHRDIG